MICISDLASHINKMTSHEEAKSDKSQLIQSHVIVNYNKCRVFGAIDNSAKVIHIRLFKNQDNCC